MNLYKMIAMALLCVSCKSAESTTSEVATSTTGTTAQEVFQCGDSPYILGAYHVNNRWFLSITYYVGQNKYDDVVEAKNVVIHGEFGDYYRQIDGFNPNTLPDALKGLHKNYTGKTKGFEVNYQGRLSTIKAKVTPDGIASTKTTEIPCNSGPGAR